MDWTDATTVEPVGDNRFRARVDDRWRSLQGAHGGIVAALAVRSAEHVLVDEGVDPATTLRAATFGYVSGNAIGDFTFDVEVVRRGRSLVTTHVRTTQDSRVTTVARLHHSTPWDGPAYSAAPPPVPMPDDAVELPWGDGAAHLHNVETHLHPDTTLFAGSDRSEWIAWCRPLHGGTFDTAWLTMFGDYFPPAVFTRLAGPERAVTIEYSLQVHSAAGSWTLADDELLATRVHAFHSSDGFAVEDAWIHHPDGTLLATVRQTRLAG